MRNLQTSDIFELARLIKTIGLKEEFKELVSRTENQSEKVVGFDLIFTVIEKFAEKNSENAFYKFLSKPFEVSPEEIEKMDPLELVEGIFGIANIEKWKSFLKLAIR